MDAFTILQTSEHVAMKSAEMALRDPNGVIITLVSVSMVFCALLVLYLAYALIGKLSTSSISLPKSKKETSDEISDEVAAAIGVALNQYFSETAHDVESYKITIKRK